MMKCNKGDIVAVKFPFTDGQDFKLRPAMVLSGESVNDLGDVLLMMITSKNKADVFSIPIMDKDLKIPLPLKSYFRIHKVFLLESALIISKISNVKQSTYAHVVNRLFEIIK